MSFEDGYAELHNPKWMTYTTNMCHIQSEEIDQDITFI